MSPALILATAACLLPGLVLAGSNAPVTVRFDITVVAEEGDPTLSEFSLGTSIVNHARYYASMRGRAAEFVLAFDAAEGGPIDQAGVARKVDITASLDSRQELVTVSGRRQQFTRIGNLLSLTCRVTPGAGSSANEVVISDAARRHWIGGKAWQYEQRIAEQVHSTPEPFDQVIDRVVARLIDALDLPAAHLPDPSVQKPAAVMVDSSVERAIGEGWRQRIEQSIRTAGRSFADQFGAGINITHLELTQLNGDTAESFRDTYSKFREHIGRRGDTMIVGVYESQPALEYYTQHRFDEVGLSNIGQRHILVKELPVPHPDQEEWSAFTNGLTLLHEIGHSYGAMHVSDARSVMCHSLTWLGSDRFDPINRQIVTAALKGELTFDDPARYVAFVSHLLRKSSYKLADYPALFYSFVAASRTPRRIVQAIEKEAFVTAAEAYGQLAADNRDEAARLFREAIARTPDQACLYFYLSQAVDGEQSRASLEKAASMGYWLAQVKLSGLRRDDK